MRTRALDLAPSCSVRAVVGLGACIVLAVGCTSPSGGSGDLIESRIRTLEARVDLLDGGDLLSRWPPPEWGKERLDHILKREIESGVFRSDEEAAFIASFEAWSKALERRDAVLRSLRGTGSRAEIPEEAGRNGNAPLVETRGRLLAGPDGPPLKSTRVQWMLDRRSARDASHAGRVIEEAVTAEDGTFRMEVPRDPGYMSVWGRIDERWQLLCSGLWGPDLDTTLGDLVVREANTTVFLKVVDPDRRPVKGAVASLVMSAHGAPIGGRENSALTNDEGRCEFRALPYDGGYWVDVWRSGFAPVRVATYQAQPGMLREDVEMTVVLPEARWMPGTVEVPPGERLPPLIEYSYDQGTRLVIWWAIPVAEDGKFGVFAARGVPCRFRSLEGQPLEGEVEALSGDFSVVLALRKAEVGK